MSPSLYQRDNAVLAKLQNLRFFPLAVKRGAGAFLYDEAGRELLDLSASWGTACLGYANPALSNAIATALERQAGASILSAASEPAVLLAEKLLEITPGKGDRRVWLGHSGSDANETVARSVVAATGRKRIMAFTGAYHGGTSGSMAVSGHSAQEGVSRAEGLMLAPYPDPYRPYGNDPSGGAVLTYIEDLFATTCPGNEVAAFFIEPIQADGGLIVPPPGFLAKLAGLCKRYGILTVCDEVKVGLGRTGQLHCFQHENFIPDIVVFGKGLGGGLPVSAVVGPTKILNFQSSFSMQTLHGNPISASAALCVLETIEAENLAEQAAGVGGVLQARLQDLQQRHEVIGDVRGRGLAIGIELVEDRESKTPAKQLAAQVVYRAFELGAVFYYVGMNSNVLELTPPLTLSDAQAQTAAEIISQAISDAVSGSVTDDKLAGFEGW